MTGFESQDHDQPLDGGPSDSQLTEPSSSIHSDLRLLIDEESEMNIKSQVAEMSLEEVERLSTNEMVEIVLESQLFSGDNQEEIDVKLMDSDLLKELVLNVRRIFRKNY